MVIPTNARLLPDPFAFTTFPPTTRLGEPRFDPERAAAYARALDALADSGVDVMLGGAHALHHHTRIWRDTKDLDVFLRPRDARAAMDALERSGMRAQVVYESWLGKAWAGEIFVDLIWRNANGLFPVEDSWFAHAPWGETLGRDVRVLPVEELIVSKIMVGGRSRFDGADVLHLLHAAKGALDWDRLATAAGEHVGLVTAYLHMYRWGYPGSPANVPDDVLARFERLAREAPSTYGPFRALFLDLVSFRVDVEGWGLPDPHRLALERIFGDAEGRT